ncbi:MAG: type II toxin-antitoxin system Phd/YefM family antitoxin [Puniceicoccaceae bacterium]
MNSVSIHEAKAKLSGLVSSVERNGGEVVLCRYGKPVARLVPCRPGKRSRVHRRLSKIRYSGDLTSPTVEEWSDA